METTAKYLPLLESGGSGTIVRVAIYARLSRDPSRLSTNTSIQVAECLAETKCYAQRRGLRVKVVAIFEENDTGASEYSKKERSDFQGLIRLIRQNKVDAIFATEVERLVRKPVEAEQLIDIAGVTDLREIHLTSEEGFDLSTLGGVYRARKAVNLAERESRKTSERLRRKLADRARNGQVHGSRRCFGYKTGNMEIDEAEASILREMGSKLLAGCSFREIAYWANERGYKTSEGKMWYPVTIRNSLRGVRYAGIREHRGSQFPATWPAIFDADTWAHMQLRIKVSARAKTTGQAELSRISREVESLGARKPSTELLTVRESLRQAWKANKDNGWRGALIDMFVERIDVFPSIGKPFVNVDGVAMRFDKDRVTITWRKVDMLAS